MTRSMYTWMRGITLVEMLVVIAVIAALSALLIPSVIGARREALVAECMGQLRQIGSAIQMYESNLERLPNWLSDLYPGYLENVQIFRCPADISGQVGGVLGGSRPVAAGEQYEETDDPQIGIEIPEVSYLYQFNPLACSWWPTTDPDAAEIGYPRGNYPDDGGNQDRVVSWYEVRQYVDKRGLQRLGDSGGDIDEAGDFDAGSAYGIDVPLASCFWHIGNFAREMEVGNRVLNLRSDYSSVYRSPGGIHGWRSMIK